VIKRKKSFSNFSLLQARRQRTWRWPWSAWHTWCRRSWRRCWPAGSNAQLHLLARTHFRATALPAVSPGPPRPSGSPRIPWRRGRSRHPRTAGYAPTQYHLRSTTTQVFRLRNLQRPSRTARPTRARRISGPAGALGRQGPHTRSQPDTGASWRFGRPRRLGPARAPWHTRRQRLARLARRERCVSLAG